MIIFHVVHLQCWALEIWRISWSGRPVYSGELKLSCCIWPWLWCWGIQTRCDCIGSHFTSLGNSWSLFLFLDLIPFALIKFVYLVFNKFAFPYGYNTAYLTKHLFDHLYCFQFLIIIWRPNFNVKVFSRSLRLIVTLLLSLLFEMMFQAEVFMNSELCRPFFSRAISPYFYHGSAYVNKVHHVVFS